jgi:hypothetical protein
VVVPPVAVVAKEPRWDDGCAGYALATYASRASVVRRVRPPVRTGWAGRCMPVPADPPPPPSPLMRRPATILPDLVAVGTAGEGVPRERATETPGSVSCGQGRVVRSSRPWRIRQNATSWCEPVPVVVQRSPVVAHRRDMSGQERSDHHFLGDWLRGGRTSHRAL